MQAVVDSPWLNAFDSIGYTLCTRSVIKNIATFAEEGDQSKASCCSINRLYFAAGTRQPFRETYFAASGLFLQGLTTAAFWGVVSVIRLPLCFDTSKTFRLFKEALIVAISNLACQIIGFVGMCRPTWGVSLWFYMTKKIFENAGNEVVTLIAQGVNSCFKELYPALLFNLGKDKVKGLDAACTSLEKRSKKISTLLLDGDFFKKLEASHAVEDRALEILTQIIEISKKGAE